MSKLGGVYRSRLAGLLIVAISLCATGALMGGSIASADEAAPAGAAIPFQPACEGGYFCMYYNTGATGEYGRFGCIGGSEYSVAIEFKSARNNCSSNAVEVGWKEGGSTNWKACLNAGGNVRTEPGRINAYRQFSRATC